METSGRQVLPFEPPQLTSVILFELEPCGVSATVSRPTPLPYSKMFVQLTKALTLERAHNAKLTGGPKVMFG